MGLLTSAAKAAGKNLLDEPMSKKTLDSLVFDTDKARNKMENSAPGEFDKNWQNYLDLRKQRDQAYKDFENQPVSTDRLERARQQGFNTDQVWYHGAKRLDRVLEGDSLKPSRATSGPMPFFTDSPELASGYTRKTDTSIGGAGDYEDWFRVSVGQGRAKNLSNVFANLSPQKRLEVREKIRNIGEDENGNISLSGNSIVSQDHWDYTLREYGNDPIKAAQDIWLNSGNLYDAEEKFIKVLKLAGIDKKIEFKDPWAEHPGILPVFARVNNPLDTGDTNALVEVLARLEEAGKGKRYKKQNLGLDPWDKSQIGIREFTDRLREDLNRGTTHAWTSIPDDVTKELKDHFGYDGVLDNSGKFKTDPGNQNKVLIPFSPNNVRSVNAEFDPKKTDSKKLLASVAPFLLGGGLLANQDAQAGVLSSGIRQIPKDKRQLKPALVHNVERLGNIKQSAYIPVLPDGSDPDVLYRVMSKAEYDAGKKSGKFDPSKSMYQRHHASINPETQYAEPNQDNVLVQIEYDHADKWDAKDGGSEVFATTWEPINADKFTLVAEGKNAKELRENVEKVRSNNKGSATPGGLLATGAVGAAATPTFQDKAVAVGETLLDAGQAMIAPMAAAGHALIPALTSDRPTAQIEQGYQNLLQKMNYEPSTQLGQEYSQQAQQFMGDAFNAAAQSAPGRVAKEIIAPINLLMQQAPERARLIGRSLLDASAF